MRRAESATHTTLQLECALPPLLSTQGKRPTLNVPSVPLLATSLGAAPEVCVMFGIGVPTGSELVPCVAFSASALEAASIVWSPAHVVLRQRTHGNVPSPTFARSRICSTESRRTGSADGDAVPLERRVGIAEPSSPRKRSAGRATPRCAIHSCRRCGVPVCPRAHRLAANAQRSSRLVAGPPGEGGAQLSIHLDGRVLRLRDGSLGGAAAGLLALRDRART